MEVWPHILQTKLTIVTQRWGKHLWKCSSTRCLLKESAWSTNSSACSTNQCAWSTNQTAWSTSTKKKHTKSTLNKYPATAEDARILRIVLVISANEGTPIDIH